MRSFRGACDPPAHNTESASLVPARRHRLAAFVIATVAVGGLAVPSAFADGEDLKEKQKQVRSQISQVQDDLHESSRRVARIVGRLERAETRLSTARARLREIRSDLQEARAERARLARKLARAQARLERVAAELEAAVQDVADQKELLRTTVLAMETSGNKDLAVMDAITDSGSIEDLLVAETAGTMVLGREDQTLEDFVAAEEALQDKKDEVREARNDVAEQKQAAEDNLATIRGLLTDARATEASVTRFVQQTRRARTAAVQARKRDRAALERLKRREAQIKRDILAEARNNPGPTYNGDIDGLLRAPSNGYVTSPFGWRIHPIYGYWGLHDGTDFGAACGSPLYAGESGTVTNTYDDQVYGNRLYLSVGTVNGANLTLVYNHLSGYNVAEGAHVDRGDIVGYVGTTGWSTGCHVHFTVLRNGDPVDPMNYL